ncbi:MAG: hypothetical protein ACK5L7_03585 [Paludibacteraceae bacterium]
MKTLDLNTYGVQEMNAAEMREVNGGGFFRDAWDFIVGVYEWIVDNVRIVVDAAGNVKTALPINN